MILSILNELAADNSRNAKKAILERERDNKLLREVIFLALDPFTQFYIRKIPNYTKGRPEGDSLEHALDMLSDLSGRVVTGHAAIDHLKYILETLSCYDANVIERIIAKDLKCGVAEGTVNDVWPGLIHEYPVLLASKYDEKLVNKIKFPAIAQVKSDGMRFNAIVKNGGVEYRSRNGKELDLKGKLDEQFLELANGSDVVYDGELRVLAPMSEVLLSRKEGNGILNKANKGTISDEEADRVVAYLWDEIPYKAFVAGRCDVPYVDRLAALGFDFRDAKFQLTKLSIIEGGVFNNIEEVREYYNILRVRKEEGLILKDRSSIWENKRSKQIIKFKAADPADLRVVGIAGGSGKYQGMLGAVICESEDGIIKVDVGSGFSDEQRKTFGNELIGKIITIEYNEKIQDKKGNWSLFLPIFIEIREDKNVANTFEEIE